jgi:hypothetical protein
MTAKPTLQNILREILYTEDEYTHNHERMGNIKPQEKDKQVIRLQHRIS